MAIKSDPVVSGTGFTDLVEDCRKAGLSDPEVDISHFGFTISIKRRTLINNGRPKSGPKSGPKSIQEKILEALCENELSSAKLVAAIGQHSLSGKLKLAIKAMLANGLIEYTIPNKPRSRLQKYRLTEKGRSVLGKPQK